MSIDNVVVIKLGGSIYQQIHPSFFSTCKQLIDEGTVPILVHGGGSTISTWMKRLGKHPEFIQGRRVTDEESLSIVTSILAGEVNKHLITAFQQVDVTAVGLSGIDLKLIQVQSLDSALGYVGDVVQIHATPLHQILEMGWIPVIASLGVDQQGQHFNVNADDAASAIAQAVEADRLLLVSDVDGVLIGKDRLLTQANAEEIHQYIEQKEITGGMIPKVQAGIKALQGGVQEVIIVNGKKPWHSDLDGYQGTHLKQEGGLAHVAISKLSTI